MTRRRRALLAVRRPAAVFLAAALALLAACATTAPPAAPVPGVAPWELPAAELGTQALYRVSFDGPEDSGSFRLTLLLEDAERYQVRAVDPLGRALWTLDAVAGRGTWIDHRNRVACRLEGSFDLAAARLAPFPLPALPALLLGRLPAAPASGSPSAEGRDGRLDFRDAEGRRWTARLEAGRPVAWTLWQGQRPELWWALRDGEAFLSDPLRGNQLRWRRTVGEELAAPLAAAAVPEGYRRADCRDLYPAG